MALTYQWYKDGSPISGATSATYTKPSAVEGDAGSYYCRVTNAFGSVNSNAANVTVYANALLLVQVDADGNIVERTGNGTITTTGTVVVDHTMTHDGFGSIRNTAAGSTTAAGHTQVASALALTGDFTIEGWWMRLVDKRYMTWLSSYPATAIFQFQNWDIDTVPQVNLGGLFVSNRSITGNEWHHFALVRSSGIATLFFDGVWAASKEFASPLSFSGLYIGSGPNNDNHPSPCCWENIRISNIARYTENFTPPGRF